MRRRYRNRKQARNLEAIINTLEDFSKELFKRSETSFRGYKKAEKAVEALNRFSRADAQPLYGSLQELDTNLRELRTIAANVQQISHRIWNKYN